jgi:hypothetical protein
MLLAFSLGCARWVGRLDERFDFLRDRRNGMVLLVRHADPAASPVEEPLERGEIVRIDPRRRGEGGRSRPFCIPPTFSSEPLRASFLHALADAVACQDVERVEVVHSVQIRHAESRLMRKPRCASVDHTSIPAVVEWTTCGHSRSLTSELRTLSVPP